MGLRAELAPRSFDSLERAEAKRLQLTFAPSVGKKFRLALHQDASLGIAGVLYDCALLLARRFVEEPRLLNGKVVEIGCGTGCAGLAAAALGAEVLLTDRSERALQVAKQSAKESGLTVSCQRWDWADPLPLECRGASTVIATDVVYSEDVSALLKALEALAAPGCVVLLVAKVRSPASLAGLRSLLNGASHLFKECVPLSLQPAAQATLQLAAKSFYTKHRPKGFHVRLRGNRLRGIHGDCSAPFANDLIGPSFARCARQGCVFLQVGEVAISISGTLSVCNVYKSLKFKYGSPYQSFTLRIESEFCLLKVAAIFRYCAAPNLFVMLCNFLAASGPWL
eukprot:s1283_g9.t1